MLTWSNYSAILITSLTYLDFMVLSVIEIVAAILLVIAILLQQRGAGLSGVFGGEGAVYRTKRGLEKTIFITTIILAVIFLVAALLNILY